MAYEKLDLKTGDRFTAENLGHIESALSEVISSDEGKAPQTTLDARVPDGLSLRIDNSVGTRIFAGNAMIHGDTGWRNVTSVMGGVISPDNSGAVFLRRIGNRVFWKFNNFLLLAGSGGLSFTAPADMRAGWRPPSHYASRTVVLNNDLSFTNNISHTSDGSWYWLNQFAEYTGTFSRNRPTKGLSGTSDFTTLDPWPTALPGLPA